MKSTFESSATTALSSTGPEAELRARVEQLELVLQATNEGLWDWNLVTGEVYYSPRWKAMLGFADDEFPNSTAEWQRRVHPDDVEDAVRAIRGYLAGERETCENEHRLRHKDGSYRWIYTRGVVTRDSDGQPMRMVGSHADITDRKRAEEGLKRRDAILETVQFATERFLRRSVSWDENIGELLERFGRATGVSRVYIFETYLDENGEHRHNQSHEWSAPGVLPLIGDPVLTAMSFREQGWERWERLLGQGTPVVGRTKDFPAIEQTELEREETLALVVVPIFVDDQWWGFIGFDDCIEERVWSSVEIEALRTAADTLGGAIQRGRAEEELAWLAAIVESSADAIIGMLPDGTITSSNAAAEHLLGYTAAEMVGTSIRPFLPPDELTQLLHVLTRLTDGERVDQFETKFIKQDGTGVDVSVTFSLVRNKVGDVTGASVIARDISDRKQAEADLRESQRSLSTLMANLPGMAYRHHATPDRRMEFVSEGAFDLTGYAPHDLTVGGHVAYNELVHPDERADVLAGIRSAVDKDEPFRVTYRIATADGTEKWVLEQGRGVRDDRQGLEAIEGIVTDVTDRVRARQELEHRVEERTRELATVLNVSTSIASTLELSPLLQLILEQFRQVVDHVAAAIFLLESESDLRLLDYMGPMERTELSRIWPSDEIEHSWAVIRSGKPIIIPDVRADTPMARSFQRKAIHDLGEMPSYISSWMGVPLIYRERVIGLLAVDSCKLDAYTERDAEIALAFASQAAVAIENARLYERAQSAAALEERQRLARELHDSVSQALFGIGLGARTARTLLDEDPARAVVPLDYVLSLAEAGLTEMRALIFELRPEALEQEGLPAALEKQAATLRARHGIDVVAEIEDGRSAPFAVEEAIYRIAQEALHNIVKHAGATSVRLSLRRRGNWMILDIVDDGVGFDPSAAFSGHLGLTTMRERAERLGGTLRIESVRGHGARIETKVPLSLP